jgi:hypothetical protein
MQGLISKTKCAFNFSAECLKPSRSGHLYMWTFTWGEVLDTKEARLRWSHFLRLVRMRARHRELAGLRVFQMHPGGHGLHVHLATGCYLYVNHIRALWRACGGGRIHVLPIPPSRVGYLARYLSRSGRPFCLKGARLWSKFGKFEATRVRDVKIESDWTRIYDSLGMALGGTFHLLKWWQKGQAVKNIERGRRWDYGLVSLESAFSYACRQIALAQL